MADREGKRTLAGFDKLQEQFGRRSKAQAPRRGERHGWRESIPTQIPIRTNSRTINPRIGRVYLWLIGRVKEFS